MPHRIKAAKMAVPVGSKEIYGTPIRGVVIT
jgi:hypothetical protein